MNRIIPLRFTLIFLALALSACGSPTNTEFKYQDTDVAFITRSNDIIYTMQDQISVNGPSITIESFYRQEKLDTKENPKPIYANDLLLPLSDLKVIVFRNKTADISGQPCIIHALEVYWSGGRCSYQKGPYGNETYMAISAAEEVQYYVRPWRETSFPLVYIDAKVLTSNDLYYESNIVPSDQPKYKVTYSCGFGTQTIYSYSAPEQHYNMVTKVTYYTLKCQWFDSQGQYHLDKPEFSNERGCNLNVETIDYSTLDK